MIRGANLSTLAAFGASPHSNRPADPSRGNGFRLRHAADLAALAAAGVTDVRLSFDWASLQPTPKGLDGPTVEFYEDVCRDAADLGLRVWATLLEQTVPAWFDDELGFTDATTAGRYWPRFVGEVADTFGDRLAGWFPMHDPIGLAARTVPDDPIRHGDTVANLVTAWRDAWRILRGGPPVATSLRVGDERPADATVPAAQAARRRDHLRWATFFTALRDGMISVPGRGDRELADLQGAADIVGIAVASDLTTADRRDPERLDDAALSRWSDRAAMLLHRVAEEGPNLPVVAVYRTGWREPDDWDKIAGRFCDRLTEAAASGLDVLGAFLDPAIAAPPGPDGWPREGLLGPDREPTALAEVWSTRLPAD